MPTAPTDIVIYKGKRTNRSWPQLPDEVLSLIASFYLWNTPESPYVPPQHDTRRWYSRVVFSCLRDVHELEKGLMAVCPEWRKALEKHAFYAHVHHIIDPQDCLGRNMVYYPPTLTNASSNAVMGPIRLTEYQHVRNLLKSSCYVCRINYPTSTAGLGMTKRHCFTLLLGYIAICKDHDKNRTSFCGLCLKDGNYLYKQHPSAYDVRNTLGIYPNEDNEVWKGVEATCRRCRQEWLLRRASQHPNDMHAIGGPNFECPDWEARMGIDSFLETAEGNFAEVLLVAREKAWLRRFTNYEDLCQQLVAAQRAEDEDNDELDEEEEEDEDMDKDLDTLSSQAPHVRDLALIEWARRRVMDGFWISPADIWYRNTVPGQPLVVPALHPLPWAREAGEVETNELGEEMPHPLPATMAGEAPPSYRLCEQAYLAHMTAVRDMLSPALRNIVRKIVLECAAAPDPVSGHYVDPAQVARKMTLEDVVRLLREEEGVWYDGVDWAERKRNEEESRRSSLGARKGGREREKEDDGDSTTSSSSASGGDKSSMSGSASISDATSPVLSTSTLQTTPSPPPLGDEASPTSEKKEAEEGCAEVPESSEITSSSSGSGPGSESASGPDTTPGTVSGPASASTSAPAPAAAPRSAVRVEDSPQSRPRFIPVDPVLSTPKLHGRIPYVPVTIGHLPTYSAHALSIVWRQACAPLYHCCCSICERAKLVELNARATLAAMNAAQAGTDGYAPQQHPPPPPPPPPRQQQQIAVSTLKTAVYPPGSDASGDIELKAAEEDSTGLEGDGEEELNYSSDLEYDNDSEQQDDDDIDPDLDGEDAYDGYPYNISPEPDLVLDDEDVPSTKLVAVPPAPILPEPSPSPTRPRKRSSEELDVEDEDPRRQKPLYVRIPAARPGSPPKRPRLMVPAEDAAEVESKTTVTATSVAPSVTTSSVRSISRSPSPPAPGLEPLSSPSRVAKRGSQELEAERDDASVTSAKRVKVQHGGDKSVRDRLATPSSPSPTPATTEETVSIPPPLTSEPTS